MAGPQAAHNSHSEAAPAYKVKVISFSSLLPPLSNAARSQTTRKNKNFKGKRVKFASEVAQLVCSF